MRVLHILADDPLNPTGGLGVAVDEITKRQNNVAVLCCSSQHIEESVVNFYNRKVVRACLQAHGQVHGGLKYTRQLNKGMINALLRHYGRDSFDAIHLHDTVCWDTADAARNLFRCPVILTSHLSFAVENLGWEDWNQNSDVDLQNELTASAESIVTSVSRAYAQEVQKTLMLDKPVYIIPNGIDTKPIEDAAPVDLKPICGDRKPVYFCGRVVTTKGIELILKAAEALPDHHFMLFSNIAMHHGDLMPLARKITTAQFMLGNITWFKDFPFRSQFGYLKAADIALVPSTNKAPFEITGLEVMASGTPLITTAICGMSEYANETNCDIHAPTAEGLIAAIKGHVRDQSKIDAALKTAKDFSWQNTAEKYTRFYEEVLNAKHDLSTGRAA